VRDTFSGIAEFEIEVEREVADWAGKLTAYDFGLVDARVEALAKRGTALSMPHARPLKQGLHELRIDIARVQWRVTYWFAPRQRIVLLTVFRKQRRNERSEIDRARGAQRRCQRDHLPSDDDENDNDDDDSDEHDSGGDAAD
jgi:hypothetical protein